MKSTILTLTFVLFSFSAHALDNCPIEFGTEDYLGKVADIATNATSCYEASEVVSACALGASGDVYTVSAAIERCSKDIPEMSTKDTETYNYLGSKCNGKYDSMEGSMYRSMNAFCHLSVTKLFVDLLSKEEGN
ncbi:MAG: hypothetical protein H7281_09045 [Bacteriovorax sp.]|nr:hypothetical protein [Bacteriovorax sp.]